MVECPRASYGEAKTPSTYSFSPSTPSVVWPRYRAGFINAGLEDSFSSLKETSHYSVEP